MKVSIKIPRIRISSIILILFCVVIFDGMVNNISTWLYFILAIIWVFFAFVEDQKSLEKALMNKAFVFFLAFTVFYLIGQLANYSMVTAIAGTFSNFLLYFPFVIGMYYIYTNNKSNNRIICFILLIVITYYTIRASVYYNANPGIARNLMSNPDELIRGLGGSPYSLTMSTNFISLFFLNNCLIKGKKNQGRKIILAVISIALSLFLCISVDSAVITLSYVICLIISLINGIAFKDKAGESTRIRRRNYIKMFLLYALITVLIFLFGNAVGSFLWWLSIVIPFGGRFLIKRLQQISIALEGGGIVGTTMSTRFRFMGNSVRTFFKYPIFGVKIRGGFTSYDVVGRHSEVIDLFAYYGIFAILLYLSLYNALKFLYKIKETNRFIPILVCLLLNSLFNPMHHPQALFSLLLIVPLLIDTFAVNK